MIILLTCGRGTFATKHMAKKPRLRPRFKRKHARANPRQAPTSVRVDSERRILAHLPRPRHLRAFVKWYSVNRQRFLLPLRIVRVRDGQIALAISAFGSCIDAGIYRMPGRSGWFSVSVSVTWDGNEIDLLMDEDLTIQRVAGGYACGDCLPEYVQTYASREALWIAHNFKALLAFVNDKLATAEYLNIHIGDQAMWASLCATPESGHEHCIASIARDGFKLVHPPTEKHAQVD